MTEKIQLYKKKLDICQNGNTNKGRNNSLRKNIMKRSKKILK